MKSFYSYICFIVDGSKYFFHDVVYSQKTGYSSVFVNYNRHMLFVFTKFL